MRTRSVTRRSIALVAATALLSGGLATGMLASPAYAALPAAEIGTISPTSWDNRSTVTLTLKGLRFAPRDQVVLVPACAPATTTDPQEACVPLEGPPEVGPITTTSSSYTPGNPAAADPRDTLTVTIDLGQAAPARYRVIVKHPDNIESTPYSYFNVFAYGGANAGSTDSGDGGYEPIDFIFGFDCDDGISNDGCGRVNGLPNGLPLDIHGANIAIGAKVRFLLPNGQEDTGLEFRQGNPSNGSNKYGGNSNGTEGSATAGTGYPSAALLQGMYRYYNDAVTGHAKFTPGIHQLQVLNTDGKTTGATATFVQPWYENAAAVSPRFLGRGAQSVQVTVNGLGFRSGAQLSPGCGTAGAATLSNRLADGTYTRISAPITISTGAALGDCVLAVVNTDGAAFGIPALSIAGAPKVTAISPADTSYAHLGQGAHVGFEPGDGNGIVITGTGFVDQNPLNAVTKDPALMTRFDFGPGITVTTRGVGAGSATVSIDVAPDTAVGRRDVRAINPDGGSTVTGQPQVCDPVSFFCEPDPRFDDIPLQINEGPKITSVTPGSFTRGEADIPVEVLGTGFHATDIADAQVEISPSGISHRRTAATSTKVTFEATTDTAAAPGPRTLTITNADDYGRVVCTACLSVDSLGVSPKTAPNTGPSPALSLSVLADGLPAMTSSTTVTMTHQTPLPGQPAIPGTALTVTDSTHGTAVFDLTNAALGRYNITMVLDPASASPTTVTCSGCFTVTGTALTLDATTPVTPNKAGQGASDWKLTFKGTGFTKGMQVSIPDVTVHDVTLVSPTELTVLTDVAPTAATGSKSGAKMTSGDGTTKAFAFTVTAAPTAKSVSAGAAYGQGAGSAGSPTPAPSITVKGSGFDADSDTQIDLGALVAVTGETVTKGSAGTPPLFPATDDSDTGTVAVDLASAPGKRAVTLLNPADGGTSSLANAFTVNAGPKISTVANENGQPYFIPDGKKHAISFFATGLSTADPKTALGILKLDGTADSALTVENVVVEAGRITADVTATGAALGSRRITLFNSGDKGFSACDTCVAVAAAPGAVPGLALSAGGGSLTATWGAAAANGAPLSGHKVEILRAGSTTPTVVALDGAARSHTFTGLINGVSYTVSVSAVNGAGTGPKTSATGVAGLPSALSIKVSPTVTTYGTPFVLSGRLTSNGVGVAGKTLIITFVPGIGKSFVRTTTTSATGTWSYKATSPYNVRVRAQLVPNDATYRPVVTPYVSETVRAKVAKTAPTTGSKSGYTTTLKIYGKVSPNKKGRYAYLYKYVNGRASFVQRVTISSTSTFVFTTKPGKGKHTYRMYVPATPGNAAGYSGYFALYRV